MKRLILTRNQYAHAGRWRAPTNVTLSRRGRADGLEDCNVGQVNEVSTRGESICVMDPAITLSRTRRNYNQSPRRKYFDDLAGSRRSCDGVTACLGKCNWYHYHLKSGEGRDENDAFLCFDSGYKNNKITTLGCQILHCCLETSFVTGGHVGRGGGKGGGGEGDVREMLKAKQSLNSVISFFTSVLLPLPDGPLNTMG